MPNTRFKETVEKFSNTTENLETVCTEVYNAALLDYADSVEALKDKAGRPAPGCKKFAKMAKNMRVKKEK